MDACIDCGKRSADAPNGHCADCYSARNGDKVQRTYVTKTQSVSDIPTPGELELIRRQESEPKIAALRIEVINHLKAGNKCGLSVDKHSDTIAQQVVRAELTSKGWVVEPYGGLNESYWTIKPQTQTTPMPRD